MKKALSSSLFVSEAPVTEQPLQTAQPLPQNISVKEFIDFDLDVVGWYALGHHNLQQFRAAVAAQDADALLPTDCVKHVWGKFDGNQFIQFCFPVPGSQPMTLLEVLD